MFWRPGGGGEKGVADVVEWATSILREMSHTAKRLKIVKLKMVGDKYITCQKAAGSWNAGRIVVPRNAPWLDDFLKVLNNFVGKDDARDDEVDALAALHDGMMRPFRLLPKEPVSTNDEKGMRDESGIRMRPNLTPHHKMTNLSA